MPDPRIQAIKGYTKEMQTNPVVQDYLGDLEEFYRLHTDDLWDAINMASAMALFMPRIIQEIRVIQHEVDKERKDLHA